MPLLLLYKNEDTPHLWTYPAFSRQLIKWDLPWANKLILTCESKTVQKLADNARSICKNFSKEQLDLMARGFWKVHSHKPSFPYRLFRRKAQMVAQKFQSTSDPNLRTVHPSLMEILVQELHLTVEANTCTVARSSLFDEWCSVDPDDCAFGSMGSFWETDLSGKNSLWWA